jgi:hypothetical protein
MRQVLVKHLQILWPIDSCSRKNFCRIRTGLPPVSSLTLFDKQAEEFQNIDIRKLYKCMK